MPQETDQERMIRALKCCVSDPEGKRACDKCPYGEVQANGGHCQNRMHTDAAMVMEKQQKQIESMNFIYGFVYGGQVKEIRQLVRCKDCRHCFAEGDNVTYNVCELNHNKVQADDWFCADGEVKPE